MMTVTDIDWTKWKKLEQTDNFLKVRAKSKWFGFYSITNTLDVLTICEYMKSKGYTPHIEEYLWDGSIIFEKVK